MSGGIHHSAEDATPRELRRASALLLVMLLVLALLVVPLIRDLPLGMSTRVGMLAWLLVYEGMGYRPLLLLQLVIFSTAATLLSAKLLLVIVDVNRVNILRIAARWLIMLGAACAGANLLGMLFRLIRHPRIRQPG